MVVVLGYIMAIKGCLLKCVHKRLHELCKTTNINCFCP